MEQAVHTPRPSHHVGGWPHLIQGPVWSESERGYRTQPERAIEEPSLESDVGPLVPDEQWQLLLQLDTEPLAGWNWDSGTVYFTIRRTDLANRRFDRAWTVMSMY